MTSSISHILKQKKDIILNSWKQIVREPLPATIEKMIPDLVNDVIDALNNDSRPDAKTSGSTLIDNVFMEFESLRKCIFNEIESEMKLGPHAREIIHDTLNQSLARTVSENFKIQSKQKQTLRRIADIQPSLIGHVDINYRYHFVNKAYEEWFGVPVNKIIGSTIPKLIGEEAFKIFLPYLEQAKAGKKVSFEKHIKYLSGIEKFVHSTLSPEFDGKNNVTGIYISVTDYTEQRKALESYMRSEQEFRNLANALPQLAWIANSDGRILWFNERFYKYTGLTPEEALGWGWLKIHDEEYRVNGKVKMIKHLESGDVWEDTFPLLGANGKWRWFLSRAIPIKNNDGTTSRWLGTNTDITEQKLISDSLHKEQILRDKFISALSHDLRTPLTSATLSSQLIPRKTSDVSVISLAQKITLSLKRVDKMIEDLLDANRLRAGQKIKPNIEEFDLSQLTRSTIQELETIYGDRFVVDIPETLTVWLSAHGMSRVIENLCSNAIKYGSSSAPVSLHIYPQGDFLELGVHNFGNPLKEEDTSKLFEEYVRAKAEEQSGKKGWGIGLSIVKGVAEAHGGDVDIDSDENGTLFKIRLPIDARKYSNQESSTIH